MTSLSEIKSLLGANGPLCEKTLSLDINGYGVYVRSNSDALLTKLETYFSHIAKPCECAIEILAIEGPAPQLPVDFIDWKREAGKTGRKDAFCDVEEVRLILKVRTGMVFLQSANILIASGPCLENDNQVINYINAQYMNHLQHDKALICHASGLISNGKALGIAGFSGGGKSTLMLKLLGDAHTKYLTNDRLFVLNDDAIGIPKLPRVNPGTMLNDPNLRPLLPQSRIDALEQMPTEDLWDLEEKYDVIIEQVYGANKIGMRAPLSKFLLLNWKRDSDAPCSINQIDLAERPDLLGAIMKSPGPFYQRKNGSFFRDDIDLSGETYIRALKNVEVFEASGQVDFDYAQTFCRTQLLG